MLLLTIVLSHKGWLQSIAPQNFQPFLDFPKFFRRQFTDQLLADQLISERAKVMLEQDYGSIILKPTNNDKKVIGSMNDCIFRVRYYDSRDDEDGRSKSPTYIGHQFNKTPMGAIAYGHPVEKMKEFLHTI